METFIACIEAAQRWVSALGTLGCVLFWVWYRRPTTRKNRIRWRNHADVESFIAWYIYGKGLPPGERR